jgi:cell division protein FtsW
MRRAATLLVTFALGLMAIGIVILYSTSSARGDDPLFYTKRQCMWLLLALAIGALVAKLDYRHWRRLAIPLLIVNVMLLIAVFLPGIGSAAKGAARWLKLGPVRFQPSELAKLTVVVGLSTWLTRFGRRTSELKYGLIYPMLPLGLVLGLIFLEPDFGTTFVVAIVGFMLLFLGGTRLSHLLVTGGVGLVGFAVAVAQDPVRLARILAFVWPDKYPEQAYHLKQSKIAFILGGWFGVGLGNSMQKRLYLPEAHTDFILSILGEEKGLMASLLVLLLFVGIYICGMTICVRALDPFGRYLAFGITNMLCVQAAINIGVVTGCLPTKGLPLPFISYGGSSMLISVVMVALLLSVAQHSTQDQDGRIHAIRDKGQRL